MRTIQIIWSILVLSFILKACQKESQKSDFTVITTHEVIIEGSTENSVEFSASILLDSDETILEQGFVYALDDNPDLQDFVLNLDEINRGHFKMELEDALVPDTCYYVRSFVRTDEYLIYGNEVTFYSNGSKAPVIENIEPAIAFWGDTIMITGENFDHMGKNNRIFFNQFEAEKLWGSNDTIYAIVPIALDVKESELSVNLYGRQSENSKSFEIYSPLINSISKSEGQYPDTVFVEGDYFYGPHLKIVLSEDSCNIISVDKNKLSFVVPMIGNGGNYKLYVNQVNDKIVANESFKYHEQIIYGLPEDGVYYGEPVILKSKNFDFRKLKLSIRINDNFLLQPNKIKQYQDSIVFAIASDYNSVRKNSKFHLLEGDYNHYDDLFSESFSFKDPIIELAVSETVINGSLQLLTKGRAKNGLFQLEGPLSIADDFILTYGDTWRMNFDLLPGVYKFYYQDEITEKTYIGDIIALQPHINELDNPSLARSYNSYMNVEGVNLPLSKEYRVSNCRVRHLESNRIFDFKDASLESCQIDPSWIVGRGDYELYIEIRGQKVSNSISFSFEDEFLFERKINNTYFSGETGSKIIQNGNKILISRGYDSVLYDLKTNTYVSLSKLNQEIDNFIYHEGQFWGLTIYGDLYALDEQSGVWQEITPSVSETWINAFFTHNDKLFVIYKNGKVFEGVGKSFKFYAQIPDYQRASNAFLHNDELFVLTKKDFLIYNPETMNLKDMVSSGENHGWHSSIRFGNLISLVKRYLNEYVLFNLETKQFVRPEIDYLPDGTSFFRNELGELFLMYDEYIYKYNPQ